MKMFVNNSICGYGEGQNTDKYIVERARAQDPTIQQLAVEVLNEYHKEVQAAQDNLENQELMQMLIAHRERRAKARAATQRGGYNCKNRS